MMSAASEKYQGPNKHALQQLATSDSARQEAAQQFKKTVKETSGLDVLNRCKKLNEFLSSDFLKGGPNSKEELQRILSILTEGPKRPSPLDKSSSCLNASKKSGAKTSLADSASRPQYDADNLLGLLDDVSRSGTELASSSRPSTSSTAASLTSSSTACAAVTISSSQAEDLDDLIGLLNPASMPAAPPSQQAAPPQAAISQQQAQSQYEDLQSKVLAEKARLKQDIASRLAAKEAAVKASKLELERQQQVAAEAERQRAAAEVEAAAKAERDRQAREAAAAAEAERQKAAAEAAAKVEQERQKREAEAAAEAERQRAAAEAEAERQRAAAEAAAEAERQRAAAEAEAAAKAEIERQQREAEAERQRKRKEAEDRAAAELAIRQCEAATTIQACCRGWLARRQLEQVRQASTALQTSVRAWAARQALVQAQAARAVRRQVAARCIQRAWRAWVAGGRGWNLGPLRLRPTSAHRPVSAGSSSGPLGPVRVRASDLRSSAVSGDGVDDEAGRHRVVRAARVRTDEVGHEEARRRGDVGARAVMAASEHRDEAAAVAVAFTRTPSLPRPASASASVSGRKSVGGSRPSSAGSESGTEGGTWCGRPLSSARAGGGCRVGCGAPLPTRASLSRMD